MSSSSKFATGYRQDCPGECGPYTTVYNRFNRWSGRGIWQLIFETVAGSSPERVAPDNTHIKSAPLRRRRKSAASEQAIGVTKGGRVSKRPATSPTARSARSA
jgi:transposase